MSLLTAVDDDFVVPKDRRQNGHSIMPSNLQDGNQGNFAGDTNVPQQPSLFPTDPSSRGSQETDINWPWESDSFVEEEPSLGGRNSMIPYCIALTHLGIRVKTWRSRFRRALHMSSGIREGYSDDVELKPEIISCMSSLTPTFDALIL